MRISRHFRPIRRTFLALDGMMFSFHALLRMLDLVSAKLHANTFAEAHTETLQARLQRLRIRCCRQFPPLFLLLRATPEILPYAFLMLDASMRHACTDAGFAYFLGPLILYARHTDATALDFICYFHYIHTAMLFTYLYILCWPPAIALYAYKCLFMLMRMRMRH